MDLVSGEDSLPGSHMAVCSLCPHMVEKAGDLWSLLYKGTNLTHRGSTLVT